ncbi:hypothetical protein ACM77Q_005383, partial [Escherichia coli]
MLNKLHKAMSAHYGLGALLNDLGDFLKRLLQIFSLNLWVFPPEARKRSPRPAARIRTTGAGMNPHPDGDVQRR